MKTSTLHPAMTFVAMLTILLFSSTSIAHSSFSHSSFSHSSSSYSRAHSKPHLVYQVNSSVITSRNGLARNYFNYSYDQRRAKRLAKHYRTNQRALKKIRRYKYSYHNYHYDDCPYTDHGH